jgi:RNA polymerase sigma-70 factor (ECF subfamily)
LDSFEKIYHQYYSTTYRIAVKLLGASNSVGDVIQDVFISLYERRKELKLIKNPGGWLYRATYYKCIDFLKQQNRFSNLEHIDRAADESKNIEQKETSKLLIRALNKLNEKERLLAILYSEGLSYKELAEATGIPFNSIGKTLSRTLKKLEKELKEEYHEML